MRPIRPMLVAFALFAAFPFLVLAQAASPEDPGAFAGFVLKLISDRNWVALTGAIIVGIVFALRKWGGNWVPWFRTDRGGVVLVLACGVLTALADGLFAGGGWKGILSGFLASASAMFLYVGPKKLASPNGAKA